MDETIADRYRRRAAAFTATVAEVPADRWGDPSPCDGWTALDVVRHVVETQGTFARLVGREPAPVPDVDLDPLGAWVAAREDTQAGLDDPLRAAEEFDGFLGRQTFAAAVDKFLALDLIVHRWDLARAAGLPDEIPMLDVEALDAAIHEMSDTMGDAMRSPRAFGPELEPPAGADAQTRALAFVGRRAW